MCAEVIADKYHSQICTRILKAFRVTRNCSVDHAVALLLRQPCGVHIFPCEGEVADVCTYE